MRFFRHLHTVNTHRKNVRKLCFKAGLYWQGLTHDLSKYSPSEFIPGVKYYQGDRSPNEKERELLGYSPAWMHHKGRNKHHIEYWNDFNYVTKKIEPVPMPRKYVAEMFCDRVAACKTYQKDKSTDRSALNYFNRRRGHRWIADQTERELGFLLNMLREKGEKETFEYIKKWVRE